MIGQFISFMKQMKEMCCLSFSLLLNCTDLDSMDDIFSIIIKIFTTETKNNNYLSTIDQFQDLINVRPKIRSDVIEVLRKSTDFPLSFECLHIPSKPILIIAALFVFYFKKNYYLVLKIVYLIVIF